MNTNLTKFCSGCHKELPVISFQRDRQKKDGLCTLCRDCRHARRIAADEQAARNARDQSNPYLAWSQRVLQRRKRRGFTIAITPSELAAIAQRAGQCSSCSTLFVWDQGRGLHHRTNRRNIWTPCLRAKSIIISPSTIDIICYPCWWNAQLHQPGGENEILYRAKAAAYAKILADDEKQQRKQQQAPQDDAPTHPPPAIPDSCGAFSQETTEYGSLVLRFPSPERTAQI